MKILFLVPYPTGQAASQRFRFEHYYTMLKTAGFQITVSPFFNYKTWQILYLPGRNLQKTMGVLKGAFRRLKMVLQSWKYDFVFIHREAGPVGPPIFEWLIAKVFKRKVIYDFDDAIWMANTSDYNRLAGLLKIYSNTSKNCNWAYKVSCGNEFLLAYAAGYNPNSYLIPTVVDTDSYHNRIKVFNNEKIVLGWTGSHSTIQYLEIVKPVLSWLEKRFDFTFLVIADNKPDFNLNCMQFLKWNKDTEIEDLLKIDLGLMPLPDDKWAKGKCGFKAIQYMSLGIPAVVSNVGVNNRIVEHGVNGYICNGSDDWEHYLSEVLTSPGILREMAPEARKKIDEHYSVKSQQRNFLKLFSNEF